MAEGDLTKVAEGVILQLGNLVVQEIALVWGVKDDLEKLKNTVSAIKAVLLDAEEKQVQSHAIKDWVGNLKDALYEADDVLDDFSTEALRREVMTRNKKAKKVCIFFSKSNQLACDLKMAHNIKAIREKLDAISANRMEFHLVEHVVETQVRSRMRETHYFVCAEDVIGREDDKKVIIERLLDSNIEENVSVLPIVGIGGLGKTTLAQFVFNDEKIQKHFEKSLWGGARGSRILVTTREMKVAKTVQTVEPHVLRGLNEDQSWSLFKQMTFENGQEPENLNIKALGMKIIDKCKGVPLAIKAIGSLLYGTNSEQEWLSFKDKELSKVGQDKNDILPTLSFKFLRRLDLKNTGISSVPCSIALKEFPRDFYKLVNLRHLVINHYSQLSHMPRELEKLTNLRTLSRFVLIKKTGSVSELTRVLKELHGLKGKLEIPNLRHGKDGAIESNILKEKHLQKLRLRWLQEDIDEADVGTMRCHSKLCSHTQISKYCLYGITGE
uniref:Rx N-terminal domain-containing protein n=1 Tax=Fagus sylvatica TaxID=28930 RepID=A0A2N9H5D2_FAGSY